jgi:hypothetical protein
MNHAYHWILAVQHRNIIHWIAPAIVAVWMCADCSWGVDFNREIRPILSEHCLKCHGPDEAGRDSEFRIDSRQWATADLGGYAGVVPGDPSQSELITRLVTDDASLRMPPPASGAVVSPTEVAMLKQWITEGAQYDTHWAYSPISLQAIPQPEGLPTAATDIDRYIVDALSRAGLSLSPEVDKRTWLRRVTFDLTGLPPTWHEVQDFEEDVTDSAYSRVVERLLASPRYGERWGRHWLDIARYADTHGAGAVGFQRFPFSYTYRDYVVGAFNSDLPYDRFLIEQLAADQLELDEHHPALAALGFLTVGRQYHNKHDIIDDRIDVVTRGLLGLTVACARCHDHKYDEIPTADYYSLYATLAASHIPHRAPELRSPVSADNPIQKEQPENDTPPGTPTADIVQQVDLSVPPQAYQEYQAELQRREFRRTETMREQSEVLRHRLRMQVGLYLVELAKGTPEQDLSAAFLSYRTDDYRPLVLERWRKYLAQFDAQDPVFGVWHYLQGLSIDGDDPSGTPQDRFRSALSNWLDQAAQENGDISGLNLSALDTQAPRWNPRVLEALRASQADSLVGVAEVYGQLFATVQQEWLQGLLQVALEAQPGAEVIPDQDPRHRIVNSSVNRQLRYHLYGPDSPVSLPDEVASGLLNRPINDHVNGLRGALVELDLNSPGSPARAMVMQENPQPEVVHVFRRGQPLQRGEITEPHFLQVLSDGKPTRFRDGQRRLDLALAIVDRSNPLARRVLVNWVWQRHFGEGLVRTPDDFGVRGTPPTHPQLLDYLAEVFMTEDNWSIKNLHRRIVLSQVYRQASQENSQARMIDPENRLLWRMPRIRLEAEAMRDAMLAVAGQLDTRMGGRPFELFGEPAVPRRSVYGFVNRDVISGFFSAFDMADPSVCVAERPRTIVPQQTLFALNSNFIQAQAQALIRQPEFIACQQDTQRVEQIYQRCFARLPTTQELQDALSYLNAQSDLAVTDAWESLAHVLLAANEFVFLD